MLQWNSRWEWWTKSTLSFSFNLLSVKIFNSVLIDLMIGQLVTPVVKVSDQDSLLLSWECVSGLRVWLKGLAYRSFKFCGLFVIAKWRLYKPNKIIVFSLVELNSMRIALSENRISRKTSKWSRQALRVSLTKTKRLFTALFLIFKSFNRFLLWHTISLTSHHITSLHLTSPHLSNVHTNIIIIIVIMMMSLQWHNPSLFQAKPNDYELVVIWKRRLSTSENSFNQHHHLLCLLSMF